MARETEPIYWKRSELGWELHRRVDRVTSRDAGLVLEALEEIITEALASGGRLDLIGFGSFQVKERKGRRGFNPQMHEPLDIPPTRVPVFKPGEKLRAAVRDASAPDVR